MITKRVLRSDAHRKRNHFYSSVHILPVELWFTIGSLAEKSVWALASTCHFLSEVLYPLLYRNVECRTPSILLRCGTAWSNRPKSIFPYIKSLAIGLSYNNAGKVHDAIERCGLLKKWRKFTPILARFLNLTQLKFIFLQLPRTFPVVLTSLPLLTDLSLESCTFEGPVSFHGVELNLIRLRLKHIFWDHQPDEITLLRGCLGLKELFLGWHYQIADTLRNRNLYHLSATLHDLTVMSTSYAWARDRQKRLQEQQTFLDFVKALHGVRRLTLNGRWPSFEAELFSTQKQVFPNYLESYTGPIHFFRSTAPAHSGLKNVIFTDRHLTESGLDRFLPSLPTANRVALLGVCLLEETGVDEETLPIVFRQCQNVKELLINPSHVPIGAAALILHHLRINIHMLSAIRYIIVSGVDAHDLHINDAFDGLNDICPSLTGIQFHKQRWVLDNGIWIELEE